jgi:lipopolysaccharide transport system permease protein
MPTWLVVIEPYRSPFDLKLGEIWRFRELVALFVWRDVVVQYKQTVLGPLWYVLQPLLTSCAFAFVFGTVARITTNGVPPLLFYLCSIACWNYFAECIAMTADTFRQNEQVFSKVYFPRVAMPISACLSNLVKVAIQFLLFVVACGVYVLHGGTLQPRLTLLLVPGYILIVGTIGLGGGLLTAALTRKYRDLAYLMKFGVQVLMYLTAVAYPLSALDERYQTLLRLNPLSNALEAVRHACLNAGQFDVLWLGYSAAVAVIVLLIGFVAFNAAERSVIDTL